MATDEAKRLENMRKRVHWEAVLAKADRVHDGLATLGSSPERTVRQAFEYAEAWMKEVETRAAKVPPLEDC